MYALFIGGYVANGFAVGRDLRRRAIPVLILGSLMLF